MSTDTNTTEVTIGEGLVVIKRHGVSQKIIANILGIENNQDGDVNKIYLDRLVHKPIEKTLGLWNVTGAISSILYLQE